MIAGCGGSYYGVVEYCVVSNVDVDVVVGCCVVGCCCDVVGDGII